VEDEAEKFREPWEEQKRTCRVLVHCLSRVAPKEVSDFYVAHPDLRAESGLGGDSAAASSAAAGAAAGGGAAAKAGPTMEEFLASESKLRVMKRGDGEDDDFVASFAELKKSKAAAKGPRVRRVRDTTISFDIDSLAKFGELDVPAPASLADVAASLDALHARLAHYRVTPDPRKEAWKQREPERRLLAAAKLFSAGQRVKCFLGEGVVDAVRPTGIVAVKLTSFGATAYVVATALSKL
jgi:hypothetical protein